MLSMEWIPSTRQCNAWWSSRLFHPSQSQRDREDQRICRNIEIKIRQTVHQDGSDTSDTAKANCGFKAIFGPAVTPDGSCENPENRGKHQDSSGQPEFADEFQIITVGVVHKKGEKRALHESKRHGKSPQACTQQRMLVNQRKSVTPDGYAVLPSIVVFVSK